ncbi:MAG: DUF1730 domain-containing protein [Caldilineae bacterium]|nr:MAG: DUF1730 domain-containing protein [Caldilineae bacterium]
MSVMSLTLRLKQHALALGFDRVAIARVSPSPDYERYLRWLQAGYAGDMHYLHRHAQLKADPRNLLPEARSLILVTLVYHQPVDPALRADPSRGQIATYALAEDYHRLMRQALIALDRWLAGQTGRESRGRVFVDSAPVLERSWSMRAGLGFIGKNTCLISPGVGSDIFLGGLLVPETLAYDSPPQELEQRHVRTGPAWRFENGRVGTCGGCSRCLAACPTAALREPYTLDARRCISYLTIELRSAIPLELRPLLGNWVFGCDLCQEVCPWNRRAPQAQHPRLRPHPDRIAPPLLDLLALDEAGFAERFRGSAVKRTRWSGFMRNVCVAAGNWGDPAVAPLLRHHLLSSPALVAGHAAWALAQLRGGVGRPILEEAAARSDRPEIRRAILEALMQPRSGA